MAKVLDFGPFAGNIKRTKRAAAQRLSRSCSLKALISLSEALLRLNILNILHQGSLPLPSRCTPVTALTLSNLQGGGPFPPTPLPLCPSSYFHSFHRGFERVSSSLRQVLGVYWAASLEGPYTEERKRHMSYCVSHEPAVWKSKPLNALTFSCTQTLFQKFNICLGPFNSNFVLMTSLMSELFYC